MADDSVDIRTLERRLALLEDGEAIRRLVHRYAQLCDDGYDADGLAELFTDDGYWTASSPDGSVSYGEYFSKDEIRQFFAGVSEVLGPLTLHYMMAPVLTLRDDGESASGTWYTLVPATMKTQLHPEGEAVLIGATYEHEYRKELGSWKFAKLKTTIHFRSPFGRGWVDEPFVA